MTTRTMPCPLCGYHAPENACPHCGGVAGDPSLSAPRRGTSGFREGLVALPRGIALIAGTRGTKRWLLPPLLLTSAFYFALLVWAWTWIARLLDAVRAKSIEELDVRVGWLRDALAWLIERDFVVWIAKAGGFVLLVVVAAFVALWTFSVVYTLIASPFLDVVQGRIETRWFGRDPSVVANAGAPMSSARRARILLACAGVSLVAIVVWWIDPSSRALLWLSAIPASFAVASLFARDFRRWLAIEIRSQIRGLWPGIKASILTAVILVLFLWLKLVPVVGYFLFAGVAGFASAIGLLDIPFSRRRFDLRQRLGFVVHHGPAVLAFGLVSSLVFLVPIVGPLIGVPASSVGGMWLLCRLDKSDMRPPGRAIAPSPPPLASALSAASEKSRA